MKRYIHSAIILLAALSLAGCSKTEEFQYNPDNALQIESVSGISPFALMQEPASKAVISGEALPGDEAAKGIGLFVTASDGGAYDGKTEGYSNIRYTYNGTKWSATSPIYLSNTTGKLYGYFPYNVDAANLTAIPVVSSLNGTDYLYATSQDVSFSNKSVNLQMNHALARLHLTIKKGDKYLSDCNLSKIVLKSKSIDATGTMDITTGAVTATKAADAIGTFTLTGSDAVTTAGIEKDILLVPADNSEGKKDITLTLTIDGVDAEVKFTADKGLDIRSGIQCNATLTIEDTGIKVSGVGVSEWGEGGSQSVEVGGHKVTVKLSEDTGIADDVLTNVKVDGKNVIIKAYSVSGQHLKCSLGEGVFSPLNKTSNLVYTFTLSNIASDITATIGYAKPVTVNVSSNIPGSGTARIEGECYEGETISFIATEKFGAFIEWQDADGNILSKNNPYDVILTADLTATAVFADYGPVIPGVFTVADDGKGNVKKVLFSKGNLWADESKALHFEETQLLFTPYNGAKNAKGHASYFTWSSTVSDAIGVSCSGDYLFCDEGHKVSVENSENIYYALSIAEWNYLLNRSGKCKVGVTVCDKTNCLIILPDDWKWEGVVGTGWQNSGYPETSTDQVVWKTMEDAGAVCLPATGSFYNNEGFSGTSEIGAQAFYWSSTSNDTYKYYQFFDQTSFSQKNSDAYSSYALRLVRDY